jgi:hypothetical protein
MPIKSLQNATGPALPRLGKLRKGGQKPARGLGQDLTYFRFTAEDGNTEVEAAFREIYGDEPAMLRVYLPYADVASNFGSWMEQWGGGERLIHRCDGEYCVKWLGDDGRYVFDPEMRLRRPCPFKDNPTDRNRCREVGRLQVILPELWEAGYVGLVTLETHSINDIVHIESVLRQTSERSMNQEVGLRGIEFVLRRKPVRISRPGGANGPATTTKWLVKIEPTSEWLLAQLELARQEQMGALYRRGAVAEVVDETPEEEEGEPEEAEAPPEGEAAAPAEAEALVPEAQEERAAARAPTRSSRRRQWPAGEDAARAGTEEAAAVPPAASWLEERSKVNELMALAKSRRLNKDTLLAALGVRRLGEISYGFEEAKERVSRAGTAPENDLPF